MFDDLNCFCQKEITHQLPTMMSVLHDGQETTTLLTPGGISIEKPAEHSVQLTFIFADGVGVEGAGDGVGAAGGLKTSSGREIPPLLTTV